MKHEVLEEVWRVRDQIAAECGYDVDRLFKRIRNLEARHKDRLVPPPPRNAKPEVKAAREESPPYHEIPKQLPGIKDENPIEEVWRIRDEISAECGHDVHRLFERLKALEAEHQGRLVSFAPRTPAKPVKKKRTARPK